MSSPPAWSPDLLTDPHAVADKRRRVRDMFAAIAESYDRNNRLHSFGRDQAWRRAAVKMAGLKPTDVVVDVACGTGDLTLAFHKALWPNFGDWPPRPGQVVGVDFTFEMLPLAAFKADRQIEYANPGTGETFPSDNAVLWLNGDAQQLPLPDGCCDVVSIAFGIRNVQNVDAALAEFHRVLRPGGRLVVLEFSEPTNPLIRWCNRLYTARIMPRTATWLSRDRSGAYAYLPQSVATFLTRKQMADRLAAAGFTGLTQRAMTFGVVVCYCGTKT